MAVADAGHALAALQAAPGTLRPRVAPAHTGGSSRSPRRAACARLELAVSRFVAAREELEARRAMVAAAQGES